MIISMWHFKSLLRLIWCSIVGYLLVLSFPHLGACQLFCVLQGLELSSSSSLFLCNKSLFCIHMVVFQSEFDTLGNHLEGTVMILPAL